MNNEQHDELAKHLDKNTYFDSNAIRHHIDTIYGVQNSPSDVKELLHRLGFVDNATYDKSVLVKEYLETSRTKIHFLPGYSPNLNLIERLWKFFKKKILDNKYYETFDEFLSACKSFFRCRTKYREELTLAPRRKLPPIPNKLN